MNEKRTILEIANFLAEKHEMTQKDADFFIRTFLDTIEESLAGDKYVKIKGLGVFKLTEMGSRESIDITTGERIVIQGHTKVSFTPDTVMKEVINKPFSHFETVILNEGVTLEDTPNEIEASEEQEQPKTLAEETSEVPVMPVEEVSEEPLQSLSEEVPTVQEESSYLPEEPLQEETLQEKTEQEEPAPPVPPQNTEKKSSHFLWGIIIALVFIILLGCYWLFIRSTDDTEKKVSTIESVPEEVTLPTPEDTVSAAPKSLVTISRLELSPEELRKERIPLVEDTLEYRTNGTLHEYTIRKGETIIRVSIKFFGSKRFWPYIANYNRELIKDPDNIPVGTTIKIPAIIPKE